MQNRYKFIIILIELLSVSSVSAANLDNNYTSINEKSIINDISNFNQIDNSYNNTELSNNYNDDSSNDKIYDNESSYDEISDDKTYDNEILSNETSYDDEISDNNDSSSLKEPSSNSNITYSYNGILVCANNTNNFIRENHYIPAVVKIDNKNVTINDYLHLLCKSLDSTTSQ